MASQSRRSRGGDIDQIHGITDDDLKYKYGQIVWVNTGSSFPIWPSRVDFVPMQMNPNYKQGKSLMQYPIFCYGSHNICWIAEDMIHDNNKLNYSKYLKAGRSKSAKDEDMLTKFEKALDELENDPCWGLDIKSTKDLEEFFSGNLKLDVSNWIEMDMLDLKYITKEKTV